MPSATCIISARYTLFSPATGACAITFDLEPFGLFCERSLREKTGESWVSIRPEGSGLSEANLQPCEPINVHALKASLG